MLGRFKGINWSNKNFWNERAEALNMMVEEYGHMPLRISHVMIYNPY